jgi:CRP-like cAMP-binding protein
LYALGDPCSDGDIFFLVSGEVTVHFPVPSPSLNARPLKAGDLCGIEEPYGKVRHRRHAAKAKTDVEVYRWTRKAFDEAMGIYQELATQVIRGLSGTIRELNRAKS